MQQRGTGAALDKTRGWWRCAANVATRARLRVEVMSAEDEGPSAVADAGETRARAEKLASRRTRAGTGRDAG